VAVTKPKDPNAMDVDNVRLNPLTNEERKKLSDEGRCFRCRKQGHMSRACPLNKNAQVNQTEAKKNTQPKTRITEVIDDRDDVSEIGSDTTAVSERAAKLNAAKMMPDAVVAALESLTMDQRNEVLDRLLLKGEDF
jgi:Zinc knuckle